jgi:hypothetical protein
MTIVPKRSSRAWLAGAARAAKLRKLQQFRMPHGLRAARAQATDKSLMPAMD